MANEKKIYLGDGAYAEFDGQGINVTAENGREVLDTVYLDPLAFKTLLEFAKEMGVSP